jgi:hypothetical protein
MCQLANSKMKLATETSLSVSADQVRKRVASIVPATRPSCHGIDLTRNVKCCVKASCHGGAESETIMYFSTTHHITLDAMNETQCDSGKRQIALGKEM